MATQKRVVFRNPSTHKQTRTIRVKITTPDGGVKITDLILQPGTVGTGWVANVTEMPWITGVVS